VEPEPPTIPLEDTEEYKEGFKRGFNQCVAMVIGNLFKQ
jgi:hypothetical protein